METCMHNVKLTQTCVVCRRYAGATEASLAPAPKPLSRDNIPPILWCATGMSEFFLSKEDCERALRLVYPDEHPDTRYARIYYKELWAEAPHKRWGCT